MGVCQRSILGSYQELGYKIMRTYSLILRVVLMFGFTAAIFLKSWVVLLVSLVGFVFANYIDVARIQRRNDEEIW